MSRIWRRFIAPGCLMLMVVLAVPCQGLTADSSTLSKAKQLFVERDFSAAQQLLESAFADDPGHPEINFYLGRCAFELGDYEGAYMAFERVLMIDPAAQRIQLEQARTLFALGNLEQARQMFDQVLQSDPPDAVEQKILVFLRQIEQRTRRHFVRGLLSYGVTADDNARASPADERINTVLGDVVLSGDGSSEQSDLIQHATLGVSHDFFATPTLAWKSRVQGYNAWYRDEDDLDLQLISLSSGPVWKLGTATLALRGQFDHLLLDTERYLQMMGGQLCYSLALAPQWTVNLNLSAADKNYFQDNGKDATQLGAGADLSWFHARGQLMLSLRGEDEDARDDRNSFERSQLGLSYYGSLPYQLRYSLGYRFQESRYRDKEPLFDQRRLDRQHQFNTSLTRPLWHSPHSGQRLSLSLSYSYFNVNSSIELYEYSKNVADVSLVFEF